MTQNVAVIGVGRMGKYHCRVLSRLGRLKAISDLVESEIGNQYQVPFYTDYKEMLKKHPEIEGVIIATPTFTHTKIAKDLLGFKQIKSILIEKPVAETIEQAKQLEEELKKTNINVSVGHIEVYNPVVQRMLKLLREDHIIGKIRTVLFQRRGAVSDGRLESIGDVYQDIGIHDFDIASRFLPQGTYSVVASSIHHEQTGIINSSSVLFYNQNISCTFLFSREYAGKIRKIEIEGEKATMTVDLLDQFIEIKELKVASGDTKSITIPFGSGERIKVYGEPLLEEIWNFIDTIEGKPPLVDIQSGIKAISFVEVVRKAEESKKILQYEI